MKKNNAAQRPSISFYTRYGPQLLTGLTVLILFVVFHDFLVFDKLYLFKGLASDSMVDTYPNYIHISDYLRNEGLPMWSFSQGMGQSVFPFSFPDPFVTFLYTLGREKLAYGIAYMEVLKMLLAALLFFLFLRKRQIDSYAAIIGGLCYAFSGFMVIGSCWNLFSTEALYLALLLYSFEKYYQDRNLLLLPLTFGLIAVLQPFDLWLFSFFLGLYTVVRFTEEDGKAPVDFIKTTCSIAAQGLLGIGMASFFFFSEVKAMLNSPRMGTEAGYTEELISGSVFAVGNSLHNVTAILRLFSTELLGASNTYQGWYNFMEAPLFYCGLITLLLIPQVFPLVSKRKRIVYGLWLTLLVLPVVFPYLRHAIWLFTGDYYRLYAFFISVAMLMLSTQALHLLIKTNAVNLWLLAGTLGVLLVALCYPYSILQNYQLPDRDIRNIVVLFLLGYAALIALLKYSKLTGISGVLILLLAVVELIYTNRTNVDERMALTAEEHEKKFGFMDYTIDAVNYLKGIDNSFYRISKDYWSGPVNHPSFNDAKIQGYKGTGSYHSFNQPNYVRFLASMNIIDEKDEAQTRWLIGLRNEPMLHSHISLKYFLSKNPNLLRHINYDSLATIGDVRIYKNKYVLPLGFTYQYKIDSKVFNQLPAHQKTAMLYKAAVINDSIFGQYATGLPQLTDSDTAVNYLDGEYVEDINKLKEDTLAISLFSNNRIKGSINLPTRKVLFFSIPYSDGWSAKVDGQPYQLIRANIGFTGLVLNKGQHNVELTFRPTTFKYSIPISITSIVLYMALAVYYIRSKKTMVV